jgi:hypothetical protein
MLATANAEVIYPIRDEFDNPFINGTIVADGYAVKQFFTMMSMPAEYDNVESHLVNRYFKFKFENLRGVTAGAFSRHYGELDWFSKCRGVEFKNVKRICDDVFYYFKNVESYEYPLKINVAGEIEYIGNRFLNGMDAERIEDITFEGKGFLNAFMHPIQPYSTLPTVIFTDITKAEFVEWMYQTLQKYYKLAKALGYSSLASEYQGELERYEWDGKVQPSILFQNIFGTNFSSGITGQPEVSTKGRCSGKFIFADTTVEFNEYNTEQWDN